MPCNDCRAPLTVAEARGVQGYSRATSSGVVNSLISRIRKSSVRMFTMAAPVVAATGEKKPPVGWRFLSDLQSCYSEAKAHPDHRPRKGASSKRVQNDSCAVSLGPVITQCRKVAQILN